MKGLPLKLPIFLRNRYTFAKNKWSLDKSIRMLTPRHSPAAILVQNGTKWWVTGGQNATEILQSTEMLSLGPRGLSLGFVKGIDLPVGIVGHCIARINNTHVFMAGGSIPNAYIFNEYTFEYIILPKLHSQRSGAACMAIQKEYKTTLMVVGGTCLLSHSCATETEQYDLDDHIMDNHWKRGPRNNLGGWSHGDYISYPDERGMVLIGSHPHPKVGDLSNNIIQFNVTTESFVKLPGVLKHSRQGEVAIYVPKRTFSCDE